MIETGHGRDELRRVPVYSLYSETREPTAEMLRERRRARRSICRTSAPASTPTSTRWPTACSPRASTASRSSCATGRIRSAASRSRGRCSIPGFESFVGLYPDSDAPRHDDRRARASVQRALRHRRRPRGRRDGGLAARHVPRRPRRRRGSCPRRTFRRSTPRSCIRAPCCSKERTSPKDAARRGRSSSSAHPASAPSALPTR